MNTTNPDTDNGEVGERLRRLRDQAFTGQDETPPWQRGTIATEVWLSGTDAPVVRRMTEVVARCLEEIPPAILPDDRFVGCVFRRLRVHQGVSDPDGWRTPAAHPERFGYDPQWPLPVEVQPVYERWLDNKPPVSWRNETREAHAWMNRYGIANPHGLVSGHTLPDHGILVENGLAELRARLATARPGAKTESARAQFAAMDRLLQALQTHVRRCAQTAREKSAGAESTARRAELIAMADDCEWLADHPPRTFAQALQLLFFSNWADTLRHRPLLVAARVTVSSVTSVTVNSMRPVDRTLRPISTHTGGSHLHPRSRTRQAVGITPRSAPGRFAPGDATIRPLISGGRREEHRALRAARLTRAPRATPHDPPWHQPHPVPTFRHGAGQH